MELLWERGEATVHDLRDALAATGRDPAYTTVLSVLQKLERAGWVGHRKEGRTYVYSAESSRAEEGTSSLGKFIDRVFRGDPKLLFQHLLEDDRLGSEDLEQLRRMIDDRRDEEAQL